MSTSIRSSTFGHARDQPFIAPTHLQVPLDTFTDVMHLSSPDLQKHLDSWMDQQQSSYSLDRTYRQIVNDLCIAHPPPVEALLFRLPADVLSIRAQQMLDLMRVAF